MKVKKKLKLRRSQSYDEVKKSLTLCETKLECEKKELERTQSSIKGLWVKFDSEEEKLESDSRKMKMNLQRGSLIQ